MIRPKREMKWLLVSAAALPVCGTAQAQDADVFTTHPTRAEGAAAYKLFHDECRNAPGRVGCLYYFREPSVSAPMVCAVHLGRNISECQQTPLDLVKRIDEFAQDICEHGGPNATVPHAITGTAEALNYACVGGRMTRNPYSNAFDMNGWLVSEWKPLRLECGETTTSGRMILDCQSEDLLGKWNTKQ
jgi:hypothetical protein